MLIYILSDLGSTSLISGHPSQDKAQAAAETYLRSKNPKQQPDKELHFRYSSCKSCKDGRLWNEVLTDINDYWTRLVIHPIELAKK